ncbi:MAG: DUF2577 domain-containing protein [Streptococcus mitis]|nr:DUF2577 domain-containing protein [Streptococcus mitis]
MAGELLARLLAQGVDDGTDRTDIVFGSVTSVSPLTIKVNNKLEIPESFLVLSPMVKELRTGDTEGDNKRWIVFRDLEAGDTVLMIKAQNGQLYYVLQRME